MASACSHGVWRRWKVGSASRKVRFAELSRWRALVNTYRFGEATLGGSARIRRRIAQGPSPANNADDAFPRNAPCLIQTLGTWLRSERQHGKSIYPSRGLRIFPR